MTGEQVVLEFVFELVLELLLDGIFALIKKYVKNGFLRVVLYALTLLAFVGILIGTVILVLNIAAAVFKALIGIFN